MAKDVTSGVKAIEVEAEQILEDARAKADDILFKAKKEAKEILASEQPVGEVQTECEEIIRKAREQADKEIEHSEKRASEISTNASKKIEGFVKLITSIVTGVKQT
jgi:vacuolar-type H+-ATPase subunit H